MVEFPYDIWLYIASFLPNDTIWDLRGLNCILHDIAMDNRYRRVVVPMHFKENKQYSRDFLRFRDERIAKRVREIAYYPNAVTVFPPATGTSKIAKRFLNVKERLQNFVGRDQKLHDTIAGFTNIKSLTIKFDRLEEKRFQECIPFFHTNFQSSSDHLQSLDFSLPYEKLSNIIPPSLFLPRLDSLSITLFSLEESPENQSLFRVIATATITPFINRHRWTLTSIDLRLHDSAGSWGCCCMSSLLFAKFDISPLLQGVKRIEHLRSVSLGISQFTKQDSIAHFIRMHSETLQIATISLAGPQFKSAGGVFGQVGIPLPNLNTFSIKYYGHNYIRDVPDQGPKETTKFIHQCSSSLTSLSLFNTRYSRDDVFDLLSPVGDTLVSYAAMRYLNIDLESLTCEIMDLFASRLPNLYKFELYVVDFMPQNIPGDEEYEFCLEMNGRDYSHWNLKHFNLIQTKWRGNRTPNYGSGAVARAIPSLVTFCGMERAQYILDAPKPDDLPSFAEVKHFLNDHLPTRQHILTASTVDVEGNISSDSNV